MVQTTIPALQRKSLTERAPVSCARGWRPNGLSVAPYMADGPARRIVIYAHRPKRAPRKAQAAAIKGPKIVTFKQSGPRLRPELEADPTEQPP